MFANVICLLGVILFGKCICLELLKSEEFMTVLSFFDHGSLYEDLNASTESKHVNNFSLDKNLFRQAGQKVYRTTNAWSFKHEDGLPYQQKTYFVGIGESVRLSCRAVVKTVSNSVSVLWSFNGRYIRLNDSTYNITTTVKKYFQKQEISSWLEIDITEKSGFGNYTCSFQTYEYFGKEDTFQFKKIFSSNESTQHIDYYDVIKKEAFSLVRSIRFDIAQYSVKEHSGEEFIYPTLGGVLDIRWKPMAFNNKNKDVLEYYYVNGVPFNRPNEIDSSCSFFSGLYVFIGQKLNWFCTFRIMQTIDKLNLFETRFIGCVEPSVFGVHTVEYSRRVYDKRSKSFVLQRIKHPDTIYVLPDMPYFYKIDNATKAKKKESIQSLNEPRYDCLWCENSLTYIWKLRIVGEKIIVFIYYLLLSLYFCRTLLPYIRYIFFKEPSTAIADLCPVSESSYTYTCYVICANPDRHSANDNLVVPLKGKQIKTGFIMDECSINKSGKPELQIAADIVKHCEHLVFYITSSFLEDNNLIDTYLKSALNCIGSTNRVLIINGDGCELPDYLVSVKVIDWLKVTKPKLRINQILNRIDGKKKNDSETSGTCIVV